VDEQIRQKYRPTIGLEVHAQLSAQSKIFCADSTMFGAPTNTQVSFISLGHPGVLPKLNKFAVEAAIRMGLACQSQIARRLHFDRKNYFYPDLPKGYQITQDATPICLGGSVKVKIDGDEQNVEINRIHLEEDAGKSIHIENDNYTILDFNRAGVPLIEIVTEPMISSSIQACRFLSEVRKLVRYLEICDGNMEEGSLRCDANVSVALRGSSTLGKKIEIKNMNSIRNVQYAIEFEIDRQIDLLENGISIASHTRAFDASSGQTFGMRTKEELNDYRYFTDPDLSPVQVSDNWLDEIRNKMPPLPLDLKEKFINHYRLPEYDAEVLTESKEVALYFEEICKHTTHFKTVSNWIMGPVMSHLNDLTSSVVDFPVTPVTLAKLIELIQDGKISFSAASQRVFPELLRNSGKSVIDVAQELDVMQDSDPDRVQELVNDVLSSFPIKVEEYRRGKKGLLAMFMGEVMKRSQGKADPKLAAEMLKKKLKDV
jgi:aspartyl-tRNA(Asn)/glutamyl-tRNA(Gln) amidotransferase subunit B